MWFWKNVLLELKHLLTFAVAVLWGGKRCIGETGICLQAKNLTDDLELIKGNKNKKQKHDRDHRYHYNHQYNYFRFLRMHPCQGAMSVTLQPWIVQGLSNNKDPWKLLCRPPKWLHFFTHFLMLVLFIYIARCLWCSGCWNSRVFFRTFLEEEEEGRGLEVSSVRLARTKALAFLWEWLPPVLKS